MNNNFKKGLDYIGVTIVYCCHDGKGNLLMHKRSKNCRDEQGRWDVGGGALEFGEKVEDGLRREVREEYCCETKEIEFITADDVHREHEGRPTHWIALRYKVLVDPKEAKIGEPDKFDELGWFTVDALPENLHSQLPGFFEKYGNIFRV